MIAGHSVNASSRRSGCSTEIEIRPRCAIERVRGTEEDLPDVHRAPQEIAANQIWIPPLKRCRRGNGPGQNAVAKLRCETRDLAFDQFGIVFRASVRHVAVSPGGMLACRSSRRVEERRLTEKHEWPVGRESSFRLDNLLQRTSNVNGGGS
jgi:hypothetical protein